MQEKGQRLVLPTRLHSEGIAGFFKGARGRMATGCRHFNIEFGHH